MKPAQAVIIDNYDSFTHNLVQLIEQSTGISPHVMLSGAIDQQRLQQATHIILSPGPGLPQEAIGMMRTIENFHRSKPILGICLGHQALAAYFGAHLYRLPQVQHGITAQLQIIQENPLLHNVPQNTSIGRYHSWCVDRPTLPAELEALATDQEGNLMVFAHTSLPIFGIQFHPESFLTPAGHQIMQNFFQ
ncbi:MAG: aminodeoxychorismate/anthranilate synthase component II [Weeksellaceae bacterium]|nr:aminodeoxychorismate/anthranilate synthase component II [Weeksellaceae bacterium]